MAKLKLNQVLTSTSEVQPPLGGESPPTAAYLHIPFCRRRCFYCDFPISVIGDQAQGETSPAIAHYLEVLCQEIRVTPAAGIPLKTVFFGGGTPSLLAPAQVEQVLTTLDHRFGLESEAEISMEIDPGTFTLEQLQGYLQVGVNRLSLGVQAFQPELLAICGRSHGLKEIEIAIALIQQAGCNHFSLDLISGLPQQTLEQWHASLEAAIALAPKHLSCYDLVVEPGTVFGKRYQPGCQPLPTDELTAQMYRLARQTLTSAGYEHYEISNYARPGYQCRHNRVYWENRPYYGFGMGATSYVQRQRYSRPRQRQTYYQWVESLAAAGGKLDCPQSSPLDILLETLMLGLRLAEGLSLEFLRQKFGRSRVEQILQALQAAQTQGWVELVQGADGWRLRLSDPEGFLFSNSVLLALWQTLDPS